MRSTLLAAAAALLITIPALAQSNETTNYGAIWTDIGVSKALPNNFSISLDAGFRTIDWFDNANRFDIGIGGDYKLGKHLKFGLSYTFIQRHFLEESEDHYGSNSGKYNGYNVDAANWATRHRIAFDVTADKRFWKTLRISLRERYQYTHQNSRDIDRTKYRITGTNATTGEIAGWEDPETTIKHKNAWNRHLLRSRLKFAIDRKGWQWEPFASFEIHNNMTDSWHFDKLRIMVGTEYAITKQHRVSAAYVFTHENDDDGNENIHAISVGYRFKF